MLKPPERHFLSHPLLLSLSWEWTQEVEVSMTTAEEWCCLRPLFHSNCPHSYSQPADPLIVQLQGVDNTHRYMTISFVEMYV